MAFGPHQFSPSELAAQLAAELPGTPFLVYWDGVGDLRILPLGQSQRVTIGRGEDNELVIDWDPEVSRIHAQLERLGGDWTLLDEGLSRNGTFLNGERIVGRRRLVDRGVMRFGHTEVLFRRPGQAPVETAAAEDPAALARITEGQRRVLVALCRPLATPGVAGGPATNTEIAEELSLSPDGVKTHIRALFAKLEIPELPQYQKRAELARRALEAGLVGQRDFRG